MEGVRREVGDNSAKNKEVAKGERANGEDRKRKKNKAGGGLKNLIKATKQIPPKKEKGNLKKLQPRKL